MLIFINRLSTYITTSFSHPSVCCTEAAVGLSSLPGLRCIHIPPAEIFHQKLWWLKVEGKFSIVGTSQPPSFFFESIAWADFNVEDNCHPRFFPTNLISFPKNDILGDRATVFYRLTYSPIDFSVLALYYPWYVWYFLSIPPTQANTCAHKRADDTHTNTIPTRTHSAQQRRRPHQTFPVVLSFMFAVLLEVTSPVRRICNAASLHLGVCWVGRGGGCIIYDEANRRQVIGTKQTREQPLIPEQSNQTQPQSIKWRLMTPLSFPTQNTASSPAESAGEDKNREASGLGVLRECAGMSPPHKCWWKRVGVDLSEKTGECVGIMINISPDEQGHLYLLPSSAGSTVFHRNKTSHQCWNRQLSLGCGRI